MAFVVLNNFQEALHFGHVTVIVVSRMPIAQRVTAWLRIIGRSPAHLTGKTYLYAPYKLWLGKTERLIRKAAGCSRSK